MTTLKRKFFIGLLVCRVGRDGLLSLVAAHGRLGTIEQPAREVSALGLPAIAASMAPVTEDREGYRRGLVFEVPPGHRLLQMTLPRESGVQRAWVNGVLALDTSIPIKQVRESMTLRVVYPESGALQVDFLTESAEPLTAAVVSWHDLTGVLTAPFMGNWPDEARPAFFGPRAEKVQHFELPAAR